MYSVCYSSNDEYRTPVNEQYIRVILTRYVSDGLVIRINDISHPCSSQIWSQEKDNSGILTQLKLKKYSNHMKHLIILRVNETK